MKDRDSESATGVANHTRRQEQASPNAGVAKRKRRQGKASPSKHNKGSVYNMLKEANAGKGVQK